MIYKVYNKIVKVSPIYGLLIIVFGIFMIRIALAYKLTSTSYMLIILGVLTIAIGTLILVSYNRKQWQ